LQISSIGNSSLYSILLGTTSASTSCQNLVDLIDTSTDEDQVALSSDYEEFREFLDKVKEGTITDDDLASMQELLNTTDLQSLMPPPPPMPSGQAEGTGVEGIGSVGAGMVSASGQANDYADSITSFLDKVKEGTVTQDDLADLQDLLIQMDEEGMGMCPPMPPMMGPPPDPDEDGETDASTVSATQSTNMDILLSFFDKVKEGTVTGDDLTEIQNILLNQESFWAGETEALSNA
jgi:hypothetical protein